MKNQDHPWHRLVRATRPARKETSEAAPFGFANRVIAQWRACPAMDEPLLWLPLLRGALICSSVILLLSLAANYHALKGEGTNELSIADSIIEMSFNR